MTNGVKQGCIVAPTHAMLTNAFQDFDASFPIKNIIDKLLHADDIADNAKTEKIQRSMDQNSQACDKYDLTTSTKVYQPTIRSRTANQPSL